MNSGQDLRALAQDAQATTRAFIVGKIPTLLYDQARAKDWRLPPLAKSYDRICFDRGILEADARLEWVTPGHPLFEAVRRQVWDQAQPQLRQGAVFYELEREQPALLELFIAGVADGVGNALHRRLFLVETEESGTRRLRDPSSELNKTSQVQIRQNDAFSPTQQACATPLSITGKAATPAPHGPCNHNWLGYRIRAVYAPLSRISKSSLSARKNFKGR